MISTIFCVFNNQQTSRAQLSYLFLVTEDVFMVKLLQGYQVKYRGKIIYPPAFYKV
ncbi:hypothetical protein [Nostoc sp.]|uniref:hypothetical protein n=1 Tax=Nostoc sp. TaxID=1180 RepID=UPI002FFC363C